MAERVVGVDEAGRGPVLGSMFVAAVLADPESLPTGIDDSKRLQPARRQALSERLESAQSTEIGLVEVTPDQIDDPETDMNRLTVDGHAKAVASVQYEPHSIVLDACDTSETRFADRVETKLDGATDLWAEHGADETHDVVGAASIVAKVARDAQIERLEAEYGEIGSGYPSDQTTRTFLSDYVADTGELPPFARASWQTSRDALAGAEQSGLAEF